MNTPVLKTVATGLFFLFIIATGFWLSRSGKPYSSLIFNIHKLIGLAAGIFLIATVIKAGKVAALHSVEITALIITILLFVSLVVAGGLLSVMDSGGLTEASQTVHSAITLVHHIFPYLAVLSTLVTIYLLLGNRM